MASESTITATFGDEWNVKDALYRIGPDYLVPKFPTRLVIDFLLAFCSWERVEKVHTVRPDSYTWYSEIEGAALPVLSDSMTRIYMKHQNWTTTSSLQYLGLSAVRVSDALFLDTLSESSTPHSEQHYTLLQCHFSTIYWICEAKGCLHDYTHYSWPTYRLVKCFHVGQRK